MRKLDFVFHLDRVKAFMHKGLEDYARRPVRIECDDPILRITETAVIISSVIDDRLVGEFNSPRPCLDPQGFGVFFWLGKAHFVKFLVYEKVRQVPGIQAI